MIKEVIAKNEERMKKTLSAAKSEFASLRAGRATPALLDKVMVEYYGSLVPVNQVAKHRGLAISGPVVPANTGVDWK